jgi:hypothetical protein
VTAQRKLVGFDLNGWRDAAARNWVQKPGEEELFGDCFVVSGGLGSSVVRVEDQKWVGGIQANLAPHGKGDGWGQIGSRERAVKLRDVLNDLSNHPNALVASLGAMAAGAEIGVLSIPDDGTLDENGQEMLLSALRRLKIRQRLLVWRPVLAALWAIDANVITSVSSVAVISQTAQGLACQKMFIRSQNVLAPERRESGRAWVSDCGYGALLKDAEIRIRAGMTGSRTDHLRDSSLPVRMALGEDLRQEPVRRWNGSWDVILPPSDCSLRSVTIPDGISSQVNGADLVLFETLLSGEHAERMRAIVQTGIGRDAVAVPTRGVAQGALVAAQRLATGLPVYFDFLPQISTIVQSRDGTRNYDLIPKDETLPAGTTYRSRKPAKFGITAGQSTLTVYLLKEAVAAPRRAEVTLPAKAEVTMPIELSVEQAPAAGRARLILTSPYMSGSLYVDWDKAVPLDQTWDDLIQSLDTPPPTVPNRMVLPCGVEPWLDQPGAPGFMAMLREAAETSSPDWDKLASKASSRPFGHYAISSDGDLPGDIGPDAEHLLGIGIEKALKQVQSRIKGEVRSDNDALRFLTWLFRRCPVVIVPDLLDAMLAGTHQHVFVPDGPSRVLVLQGLGRVVSEPGHQRRVFDHLFDTPLRAWRSRIHLAAAAFLLSRTDAGPQLLKREEVEFLGDVVISNMKQGIGTTYTNFHYAPFLLVGLLRWRLVDPWALVSGSDPLADRLASTVANSIGDLRTKVRHDPRLKRYIDILEQVQEELAGRGRNPDLLLDLATLG